MKLEFAANGDVLAVSSDGTVPLRDLVAVVISSGDLHKMADLHHELTRLHSMTGAAANEAANRKAKVAG
jgi:hypothetical protein